MPFYVIKASGQKELFDIRKFRRSLQKAGASSKLVSQMVQDIKKQTDLRSTKDIYEYALAYLDKKDRPVAARYNLKKALRDLGPAGFPFEKFIAELFRAQGFTAEIDKIIHGICVEHEVDISATKKGKHYIVECKFHNRRGLKSDIKVALYIKARYDDIEKAWSKDPQHSHKVHGAWIVTNTKFTSKAIQFGTCVGLHMLDWKHPTGKSLPQLIDKLGLHPITALTSLNAQQKRECIKSGLVLCRHAKDHKETLRRLRLSDYKIKRLIQETQEVCTLKPKK